MIQERWTGEGARQVQGMLAHGLGPLDQGALRERPTAGQEEPMLDDHRQEFGQDLAQDAPGAATARLITVPMAFPELEEQVDLPAGAKQDEGLGQGEQGGG